MTRRGPRAASLQPGRPAPCSPSAPCQAAWRQACPGAPGTAGERVTWGLGSVWVQLRPLPWVMATLLLCPHPDGVEIDAADVAHAAVRPDVHDDVDGHAKQALDDLELQTRALGRCLHHQGQLVPGLGGAPGVAAGDRAGMARGAVADEVERLVAAQ